MINPTYLAIDLQYINGTTLVAQFQHNCLHALHNPTIIQTKSPRMKYCVLISDERSFQCKVECMCFAAHELFHTLLESNLIIAPHRVDKASFTALCFLSEEVDSAYKFWTCAFCLLLIIFILY